METSRRLRELRLAKGFGQTEPQPRTVMQAGHIAAVEEENGNSPSTVWKRGRKSLAWKCTNCCWVASVVICPVDRGVLGCRQPGRTNRTKGGSHPST